MPNWKRIPRNVIREAAMEIALQEQRCREQLAEAIVQRLVRDGLVTIVNPHDPPAAP